MPTQGQSRQTKINNGEGAANAVILFQLIGALFALTLILTLVTKIVSTL